jgi:hypothetical protein
LLHPEALSTLLVGQCSNHPAFEWSDFVGLAADHIDDMGGNGWRYAVGKMECQVWSQDAVEESS